MLATGQYPNKWKRAQVIPIPKLRSPSTYKDYRPISLLFHLGKLAEDVIISKMCHTIDSVIEKVQYAYRSKLGTTDAILQLVDDFVEELDKPSVKFMQSACLDFSKAFDRLQSAVLLSKMSDYGFSNIIIQLVGDFLDNRMQCVKFDAFLSPYIDIKVGTPQGTKLGPYLWLIYVNDLSINGFKCVKYADDTSFYRSVTSHTTHDVISPAISGTKVWAQDNSMLLNMAKTVIMNTSLSHRHVYDKGVDIDGCVTSPSLEVRFLGVIIDSKLTFTSHVSNIVRKCNSKLFLMRQLKGLGLSSKGLNTFYCSNVRSIITYAAPAWYSFLTSKDKLQLEKIQRAATRVIYPDSSYEQRLNLLHLPTISSFINNISIAHFTRICTNSAHPLFNRVVFNHNRTSSRNGNMKFHPAISRTKKHANSFFQFYMRSFNNDHMYVE
jgi:hypothetical protein